MSTCIVQERATGHLRCYRELACLPGGPRQTLGHTRDERASRSPLPVRVQLAAEGMIAGRIHETQSHATKDSDGFFGSQWGVLLLYS